MTNAISKENSVDQNESLESQDDKKNYLESAPHILDLPTEILLKIFQYLSGGDLLYGVSKVCERFKALADDGSLTFTVQVSSQVTEERAVRFFNRKSHQIKEISLFSVGANVVERVAQPLANLPKLTGLRIARLGHRLPANFLSDIFERKKLKILLIKCNRARPDLSKISECQDLTCVHISHPITPFELNKITLLPALRSLDLFLTSLPKPEVFVNAVTSSSWSSLEELHLTFFTFNDACLHAIAKKCPNLKKLRICSVGQVKGSVTSEALDSALIACSKLKRVFLTFNHLEKTLQNSKAYKFFRVDYSGGFMPCVYMERN
jgi:hypothetical protein